MPIRQRLTSEQRDRLISLLDARISGAGEAVRFDMLHGFFTSLACGPVVKTPQEWLPVVLGTGGVAFESEEQAQEIVGLLITGYNEVVEVVRKDRNFVPIFGDESGKSKGADAVDWCHGFLTGISLSKEDWRPLIGDRKAIMMLGPIYILGADPGDPRFADIHSDPGSRADLITYLPDAVENCLSFWADLEAGNADNKPEHRGPKPGRNDPCPCGSGKKYKRCCGGPDAAR